MEECVKASNKHVSEVSTLTYVYDVRGWISDHLEEIRYHTQPHIFLFKRNPTSGRSQMFYKHWSHDSWEPSGSSGLTLLKVCGRLLDIFNTKSVQRVTNLNPV